MSELSHETGRQIGVLINRKGQIEYVMVGTAKQIELPDFGRARVSEDRFRGLRCVHTHLLGEKLTQDDLTDLALLRLERGGGALDERPHLSVVGVRVGEHRDLRV